MDNQESGYYLLPLKPEDLELFEWTTEMQVDDGLIDKDHKELLAIANRVLEIDNASKDAEELKLSIRELYEYVQYHFQREEDFMRESEYPDIDEHRRKHKIIIKDMNNTLTHAHHMGDLLEKFREIVFRWVISHIRHEDKKIRDFLQNQAKH